MHFNNTFPINWLKYTKPLYAASQTHAHSDVNKPNSLPRLPRVNKAAATLFLKRI